MKSSESPLPIPAYLDEHGDPAALFTRLQRVVIHMGLLQQEAVRNLDISFSDFVVLATLRREPAPHELLVSQVAEYVLRPMGSISQVLERLERAGLIARTHAKDDRRKVVVSLTADGARMADDASGAHNETRKRVFKHLTADELDELDDAVTKLLGALDDDYQTGRSGRP